MIFLDVVFFADNLKSIAGIGGGSFPYGKFRMRFRVNNGYPHPILGKNGGEHRAAEV